LHDRHSTDPASNVAPSSVHCYDDAEKTRSPLVKTRLQTVNKWPQVAIISCASPTETHSTTARRLRRIRLAPPPDNMRLRRGDPDRDRC
jgi:hypothetical protein